MRTVIILLLLANLTLFGFTRLDSFGGSEPARLAEQVQPDKIKILSAQEVAALGPSKMAALADVCIEWGPLTEAERTRALGDLAPLALGPLLTQRRVDMDGAWTPMLGPFATRAMAERRVAELRARGIGDAAIVDNGKGQFNLALGVFRTEQAAAAKADALAQQGVTGAKAAPRGQAPSQYAIVVRDPPQPVVMRLKELQSGYPGSDLKIGTCERTS
jgi:hypothetical protein